MGATKTDHFTDKQNAIAILAKALGPLQGSQSLNICVENFNLVILTIICNGNVASEQLNS